MRCVKFSLTKAAGEPVDKLALIRVRKIPGPIIESRFLRKTARQQTLFWLCPSKGANLLSTPFVKETRNGASGCVSEKDKTCSRTFVGVSVLKESEVTCHCRASINDHEGSPNSEKLNFKIPKFC